MDIKMYLEQYKHPSLKLLLPNSYHTLFGAYLQWSLYLCICLCESVFPDTITLHPACVRSHDGVIKCFPHFRVTINMCSPKQTGSPNDTIPPYHCPLIALLLSGTHISWLKVWNSALLRCQITRTPNTTNDFDKLCMSRWAGYFRETSLKRAVQILCHKSGWLP